MNNRKRKLTTKRFIAQLGSNFILSHLFGEHDPADSYILIGGHYHLNFDEQKAKLVPFFENRDELSESNKKLFNFTMSSFKNSVLIYEELKNHVQDIKAVLLVNDEAHLRQQEKGLDIDSFRYRKEYYSTKSQPLLFEQFLKTRAIDSQVFYHQFHNESSHHDSFIPEKTWFVSERRLCKEFKKTIKKLPKDAFKLQESNLDVQFAELKGKFNQNFCVIDNSKCSCGGKSLQFYVSLFSEGFNNVVFFVPSACRDEVIRGTELYFLYYSFTKAHIRVILALELNYSQNQIEVLCYDSKPNYE